MPNMLLLKMVQYFFTSSTAADTTEHIKKQQ
jgi:hypothetical protein